MRALAHDAATDGPAAPPPRPRSERPIELGLLLTATIVFVVVACIVVPIGLGLFIAGKLPVTTLPLLGVLVALIASTLTLCYFWSRRWTRGRAVSGASPRARLETVPTTMRRDVVAVAPTSEGVAGKAGEERTSATRHAQLASDDEETLRLPDK
jgi:hypothetical protein